MNHANFCLFRKTLRSWGYYALPSEVLRTFDGVSGEVPRERSPIWG
jgi:hypothetical protein